MTKSTRIREKGTIIRWQGQRSFGFIQPVHGEVLFVHVRAFAATSRRPADGDEVYFLRDTGRDGKPCAGWAAFATPPSQEIAARVVMGRRSRPWPALLFMAMLCGLYAFGKLPRDVLMIYALASLLALAMYYRDKQAALRQRWRTPERTLHWVALLGGWPGAMLAHYVFRHKSVKPAFRRWFWCSVLLNVAMLAWGLWQGERLLAALR